MFCEDEFLNIGIKVANNNTRPDRNDEVLEFLKTRRSVPSKMMGGPAPSLSEIEEMLQIASRVPDHGKLAPWRFVLYSDIAKTRINKKIHARAIALNPSLNEDLQEVERTRFSLTQAIIGIYSNVKEHPKVPVWEQELSAGASAMNFLIAANAFGYDAQWFTGWYAFDEALTAEFGLQEKERVAGFMHIGTRKMPKSERPRPALEHIFSTMES